MATAFLLGLIALFVLVVLVMLFERAEPAKLARALVWLGIALAGLLVVALLLLGRIGQGLPALAATLLLLWQQRALQRLARRGLAGMGAGRRRAGAKSRVETAWLEMSLDLASGRLDGRVRQGRFAGRQLSTLSDEDCLALYGELAGDEESRRLLAAYLDRRMPGWRARAGAKEGEADGGPQAQGAQSRSRAGDGEMTRAQALRILGLDEQATRAEIIAAHRRLMQKVHPDHGGSDYLAAQINLAKRVLLGER